MVLKELSWEADRTKEQALSFHWKNLQSRSSPKSYWTWMRHETVQWDTGEIASVWPLRLGSTSAVTQTSCIWRRGPKRGSKGPSLTVALLTLNRAWEQEGKRWYKRKRALKNNATLSQVWGQNPSTLGLSLVGHLFCGSCYAKHIFVHYLILSHNMEVSIGVVIAITVFSSITTTTIITIIHCKGKGTIPSFLKSIIFITILHCFFCLLRPSTLTW